MGGKGGKSGKGKGKGRGKAGKADGEDDARGKTSELHTAAREGDMVQITQLLADTEKAKDLNSGDQHRRTPLHLAAFFGKEGAVQKLLDANADAGREAMDGYLPLHFAAQGGHLEVLRLIVRMVGAGERGAVKRYVNRVVSKGKRSALHLALQKGHIECARFLVMKGASTSATTSQGQSVLDLCPTDELRKELGGAEAAAAAAEQKDTEKAAAESKEAEVTAETTQAAGEEPAAKKARIEEEMDPVETPSPAAAGVPGVLACGPFDLGQLDADSKTSAGQVEIVAPEAERVYPAGVGALANVHWGITSKANPSLMDGPVWSVTGHQASNLEDPARKLSLTLQKSKYRFVEYTNFSDEGKLLPASSRCNPCGAVALLETSDGLLALAQRNAEASQLPGRWHAWPAGRLDTADLHGWLKRYLDEELSLDPGRVRHTRVVALVGHSPGTGEDEDEALEGRAHELVLGLRVPLSGAEVLAAFEKRRTAVQRAEPVGPKAQKATAAAVAAIPAAMAFVHAPGRTVPATALPPGTEGPNILSLDELLADSGRDRLTVASRRALELLCKLRSKP